MRKQVVPEDVFSLQALVGVESEKLRNFTGAVLRERERRCDTSERERARE